MATTTPGLFMVEANVGNCGQLACTKKSWANKVRETANGIAKCARNSFALPLPTGRFMHGVGTVRGGQDVAFTRARVIGSGPSAVASAKPTAVSVTSFPEIAPSTVDHVGDERFQLLQRPNGGIGFHSIDNRDERLRDSRRVSCRRSIRAVQRLPACPAVRANRRAC